MLPKFDIKLIKKGKRETGEIYKIKGSKSVFELAKKVFDADKINWREEFIIFCLNRANNCVGWAKISEGGMAGTVVDPKMIFTYALKSGASAIILAHNHPSGNKNPSRSDITITNKIVKGGQLLDITVLDHLIITDENGFYSFADECMI